MGLPPVLGHNRHHPRSRDHTTLLPIQDQVDELFLPIKVYIVHLSAGTQGRDHDPVQGFERDILCLRSSEKEELKIDGRYLSIRVDNVGVLQIRRFGKSTFEILRRSPGMGSKSPLRGEA